jgi:predicted nucleic-acid-binding protein
MKALDTNVLARFFIDDLDDPQAAKQRRAATEAMQDRAFVSVTVLLEFEWVMRGFYELPRHDVAAVLHALAGIEHLILEDRDKVLNALDAFEYNGLDFADALHLCRSAHASALVTFDKQLARRAKTLEANAVAVELLKAA